MMCNLKDPMSLRHPVQRSVFSRVFQYNIIRRQRALQLVALLRKETCNWRHPMHLCQPVTTEWHLPSFPVLHHLCPRKKIAIINRDSSRARQTKQRWHTWGDNTLDLPPWTVGMKQREPWLQMQLLPYTLATIRCISERSDLARSDFAMRALPIIGLFCIPNTRLFCVTDLVGNFFDLSLKTGMQTSLTRHLP